mmetsp:Transcript_94136/g.266362  ORF Transcript_94136/g.266362 Transcript_94136/m.266362 type:complete len:284 (+) Transcript_94136:657-1508(+)
MPTAARVPAAPPAPPPGSCRYSWRARRAPGRASSPGASRPASSCRGRPGPAPPRPSRRRWPRPRRRRPRPAAQRPWPRARRRRPRAPCTGAAPGLARVWPLVCGRPRSSPTCRGAAPPPAPSGARRSRGRLVSPAPPPPARGAHPGGARAAWRTAPGPPRRRSRGTRRRCPARPPPAAARQRRPRPRPRRPRRTSVPCALAGGRGLRRGAPGTAIPSAPSTIWAAGPRAPAARRRSRDPCPLPAALRQRPAGQGSPARARRAASRRGGGRPQRGRGRNWWRTV